MNTKIKITLKRLERPVSLDHYKIVRMVNAVSVDAGRHTGMHVGDLATEQEAEELVKCKRYEVTVTE